MLGATRDSLFFSGGATDNTKEVSGIYMTFLVRPYLGVGWQLWRGVTLTLKPLVFEYSPRHSDFSENIEYILRYNLTAGLRWQWGEE